LFAAPFEVNAGVLALMNMSIERVVGARDVDAVVRSLLDLQIPECTYDPEI